MTNDINSKTRALFKNYAKNHINTMRLIELSAKGIYSLSKSYELVAALAELERLPGEEVDEKKLEEAKSESEFAQSEVDKGFPLLYSQGTVWMWGQLEAFMEDLVVLILEEDLALLQNDTIRKIRIPLAQYMTMDERERRYFILDTVQRDMQSKFKQGITQFESILEVIGLAGSLDEEVRRLFYELSNIRNILVHRRGVADRRVVEACPWMALSIGDHIKITRSQFTVYGSAIAYYVGVVQRRITAKYNGETASIDNYLKAFSQWKI